MQMKMTFGGFENPRDIPNFLKFNSKLQRFFHQVLPSPKFL